MIFLSKKKDKQTPVCCLFHLSIFSDVQSKSSAVSSSIILLQLPFGVGRTESEKKTQREKKRRRKVQFIHFSDSAANHTV